MNPVDLTKLTDNDVADMSAHLGFEMGSAAAAQKFAHEINRYNPKLAKLVLATVTPAHQMLLDDLNPSKG